MTFETFTFINEVKIMWHHMSTLIRKFRDKFSLHMSKNMLEEKKMEFANNFDSDPPDEKCRAGVSEASYARRYDEVCR